MKLLHLFILSNLLIGSLVYKNSVSVSNVDYLCNDSNLCSVTRKNITHVDGSHSFSGKGKYNLMVCEAKERNYIAVSVSLMDAKFDIVDINNNSIIPERSPTYEYCTGEYIVMTDTTSTQFTLIYEGNTEQSACEIHYVRLNY